MITINKAEHKLIVYNLFQENGKEKHFPLSKLKQASSLVIKVLENADAKKNDEGLTTGYSWEDSDIELVLDEAAFLKEQLNAIQKAAPSEYQGIEDLKVVLDGKPKETPEEGK